VQKTFAGKTPAMTMVTAVSVWVNTMSPSNS